MGGRPLPPRLLLPRLAPYEPNPTQPPDQSGYRQIAPKAPLSNGIASHQGPLTFDTRYNPAEKRKVSSPSTVNVSSLNDAAGSQQQCNQNRPTHPQSAWTSVNGGQYFATDTLLAVQTTPNETHVEHTPPSSTTTHHEQTQNSTGYSLSYPPPMTFLPGLAATLGPPTSYGASLQPEERKTNGGWR